MYAQDFYSCSKGATFSVIDFISREGVALWLTVLYPWPIMMLVGYDDDMLKE